MTGVQTCALPIYLKVNISDTASMLTNYAKTSVVNTKLNTSDSSTYQTKYRTDTMRTNVYSAINGKQASGSYITTSDTSVFLRKSIASYSFMANKTSATSNIDSQAYSLLVPTDYMDSRKANDSAYVPPAAWITWRASIRTQAATAKTAITASTDIPSLITASTVAWTLDPNQAALLASQQPKA